jgi:hypothetical protein
MALLGFGAAGSFLAVTERDDDEREHRGFLARNALLFGLVTLLSVMVVFDPTFQRNRCLLLETHQHRFARGAGERTARRTVIGIAALVPVSFALGMPLPLGVRLLERSAPNLVPWAWACNACLTVIGSVLCLIISMGAGFATALAVAAVCYVVAGACVLMAPSASPVPQQVTGIASE